jgi:hypothetical protein
MRRILAGLRDFWYRTQVVQYASRETVRITVRSGLSIFFGMTCVLRWYFFPDRYSIAHSDETARGYHKFGYRWYPDEKGRMICTGCKTGRPMDFLSFVLDYGTRWDPAAAHKEMLALIDRGEAEDTEENKSRWANIPEDSMILWTAPTMHPPHSLPMVVAFTHDGNYYSTCLSHLGDLRSWEYDLFVQWMEAFMPEWSLERKGETLYSSYEEGLDIMDGVNPYAFMNPYNMPEMSGAALIYNHEEDPDE